MHAYLCGLVQPIGQRCLERRAAGKGLKRRGSGTTSDRKHQSASGKHGHFSSVSHGGGGVAQTGNQSYGCSTVVLIGCTCPAITVVTVILRALDRVRERALG